MLKFEMRLSKEIFISKLHPNVKSALNNLNKAKYSINKINDH